MNCFAAALLAFALSSTEEERLLEAFGRADLAEIHRLLDQDSRLVQTRDRLGRSLLDLATSLPSSKATSTERDHLIDRLIFLGLDVDTPGVHRATPLYWVALHGKADVVSCLLDLGADPNAEGSQGRAPLHAAVATSYQGYAGSGGIRPRQPRREHRDVARLLLDRGANANARDDGGATPLHHAAWHSLKAVDLLLSRGAEVDAVDDMGCTPLHRAASGWLPDTVPIVRRLLEVGARLEEDHQGATPLDVAACMGRNPREIVDLLIDHGATPAIHHAVALGDVEWTRSLLEQGLSVDESRQREETPIVRAIVDGDVELVELLTVHGAEIPHDAVLRAVSRDRGSLVEWLLRRGLPVDGRDTWGRTPLHVACRNVNTEMIRRLLAHGADVQATYQRGATPLETLVDTRRRRDKLEAMRLLVGAGATLTPELVPIAAGRRDVALLEELLERVGIATSDVLGEALWTALDGAREHSMESAEIIRVLGRQGADPTRVPLRCGSTLLHEAVANGGFWSVGEALLEIGADPATVDAEGRTPIDVARSEWIAERLRAASHADARHR